MIELGLSSRNLPLSAHNIKGCARYFVFDYPFNSKACPFIQRNGSCIKACNSEAQRHMMHLPGHIFYTAEQKLIAHAFTAQPGMHPQSNVQLVV